MYRTVLSTLALTFAGTLAVMGATPAIGVVQASGEFRLNQAAGYANGTLFDGALLETQAVRSDVTFTDGGHLAVAPKSRTRVYKTYAVLETGAADVAVPGYTVKASSLSISGSGAQVSLTSPTKVQVGAVSSPVEVRNASNMLIARVFAGSPLEFETAGGQGGASGPVTITGTLEKKGDKYFVTDATTNVTYEVTGKDLAKNVGKKVKVSGSVVPGVAGAVPVVAAASIAMVAAGAAVAGGLSAAAITGIVVGGATAAGLGIAAGTGAFDSSSSK